MLKKALSFLQLRKSDFFGFRTEKNRWHALKDHLKLVLRPVVLFILFWSILNSGSSQLFGQLRAEQGTSVRSISFYAGSCESSSNSTTTGWQGPGAVSGTPTITRGEAEIYNELNSAVYLGGESDLICEKYQAQSPVGGRKPEQADQPSKPEQAEMIIASTSSEASSEMAATSSGEDTLQLNGEAASSSSEVATSSEFGSIFSGGTVTTSEGEVVLGSTTAEQGVEENMEQASGVKVLTEAVGGYDLVNQVVDMIAEAVMSGLDEAVDQVSAAASDINIADDQKLQSAKIRLSLSAKEKEIIDEELGRGTTTNKLTIWYSLSNNSGLELSASSSAAWSELWQELAVLPIGTSTDCADVSSSFSCLKEDNADGGYLVFDAPFIKSGSEAKNIRIKISGSKESSNFITYLDSVWVTAAVDEGDELASDDGYAEADMIEFNGQAIDFGYTDDNSNENLIIKTDRASYEGVNGNTVYFSVTNAGTTTENVKLQAHFPNEAGDISAIERIRLDEKSIESVETSDGAYRRPNILDKAFYRELPRKPVPNGLRVKKSTRNTFRIAPGRTQYFKMEINYPEESKGEFYIEAEGDNEGYGLLDPWWSSSWSYKLPITIDNTANPSSLSEYQVLVEISSTTPNFWGNVNKDGSDIRFVNSAQTGNLKHWTQYFNGTGSSTQIWVQVDSIPANSSTTIYLYYGNAGAASTSDMYGTFTYSDVQKLFYVVTNSFATVTVVSLIDNNVIQYNNGATSSLNRQQILNYVPVTATSTLSVKGPVQASITGVQAGTTLVPIAYAGTAFVMPLNSGTTETWSRYAPFAGATTTIYNGATLGNTTFIGTGTAASTAYNITGNGRLLATNPILATFYATNATYSGTVYPATSRDLYGIRSGTNMIGFTGNTNFSIYCSGGASLNVTAQTVGAAYTNATCVTANEGVGNAVRLTAQTSPIGSVQYNDSDGTSLSYFLPDTELSTEYMVPRNAAYIAVACPPKSGTTSLSIYNPSNVFVTSGVCTSTGNFPGKAYFGVADVATYNAGSRIVSTNDKPFYAYYEDVQALVAVGGDESNFIGAVQARKQALNSPIVTIGTAQSYKISFSGKVYSDEGTTALLTRPVVNLAIEGNFIASTTASGADGSFTIANIPMPEAGSSTLVYLASSTVSGAAYSRYVGNGTVNNYDIYQNRIIVRHDDQGPITNADIDKYDADQDAFIKVQVLANNLIASSTQKLFIWPGKKYQPGGAVNLPAGPGIGGSITIATSSVFEVADNAVAVGGNWTNLGTFSKTSGQITTFTATSAGKVISNSTSTFNHVVFNGAGGGWTFSTSTFMNGNLLMSTGTLASAYNISVSGGTASGTGIINMTGGTFTLTSSGEFGGSNNWTFNSLVFGNGTVQATTTKVGNGSTTVLNVLNLKANHFANAGSADWLLAGSGTPFLASGLFIPQASTFKYMATSAAMVATTSYYNLQLTPSAAGSPTFTIATGSLAINGDLKVGDGTNPVTVTAKTNNAGLDVNGNVAIGSSGSLVAGSSSSFTVAGSWINAGSFTHSSSTIIFDASTTGKVINPGASPFYNITFNNPLGGWLIDKSATSTNDWSMISGSQFTASTTATIEVKGYFTNGLNDASTTWTGSTLYLSGKSQEFNAKGSSPESYGTLKVGPNVDIGMWNSNATAYSVDPTGSLYSMDHGNVDGELYIWGDYHIAAGTKDWSYAIDFDGADLSASPRKANIRLSSGSIVSVDGGTLNIAGTSTNRTTITNQGSGNYAFNVSSGVFYADYYEVKNADSNGLNFSGTPNITHLGNGDFQLAGATGRCISLTPSVVDANPSYTPGNINFATTTAITTAYNVFLSGAPTSNWTFANHTGLFAGENYDSDPGDPAGYILWDDSPVYTVNSQNWRWYTDISNANPSAPAANENVAIERVASNTPFKLRITIKSGNIIGNNIKMRLQYSTSSNFSGDAYFVDEIGSSTPWVYANGVDADNAAVTARVLSDSTANATHNESGLSASTYTHPINTPAEWEFTIKSNSSSKPGETYYFRPYTLNRPVALETGASYPSIKILENISISGTLYSDAGSNRLLNGQVVGLAIGNQLRATTTASSIDGSFSFSNLDQLTAGQSTVIFLDNSALEAPTSISYFNSTSTPADNGASATNPTVVIPPSGMQTGDLVILEAAHAANTGTLAMSNTGGQTWNVLTQRVNGVHTVNLFWAQFNGTWSANPSVNMVSAVNNIVVMHVFRPGRSDSTWAIDVPEASAIYAASTTAFIPSVVTQTDGALVFAAWTSADDNTWGAATAGWSTPGTAQYRNTSGASDQSITSAYMIKATAGATGAVSKTQTLLGPDAGTIYSIAFKEVKKTSVYGATFSRYAGAGDMANMDVYQDRAIVRHNDAGPITNADLDNYDGDQNSQIKATVTAGNLSVLSTQMLYVWPNSTFRPGGQVTLAPGASAAGVGGDLYIASGAILNAESNDISVGGDWTNDGNLVFGANQNIYFTATSAGFSINPGTANFNFVNFTGVGGGWSFTANTLLSGDLNVATGTLSGTSNITVFGGNVIGNGAINMTGGTLTQDGSGNFGGAGNWSFNNLRFGSSTVANVSKAGIGAVNVASVLTIGSGSNLNASSSVWNLAGGGNPLIVSGAMDNSSSTIRFTANSNTNINALNYNRLELVPGVAGSPVYTAMSGTLKTNDYLLVGDGVNPVALDLNSYSPSVSVGGNLTISTSSSVSASASSNLNAGGSWLNTGTFTHNNGTVVLTASSTGKTISAGNSSFYKLALDNPLGGWTINQNATTVDNFTLATGSQFTLASGVTLEVRGLFNNYFSKAQTVWTGSKLFLNGLSQTLNTKNDSGANFGELQLGNNTKVKMWNCSVATATVPVSSSLYSMDNNAVDGNLYVWGAYTALTPEYWDYKTDFDGTDIASTPRAAHIFAASSSAISISTTTLEMIGTTTATTTIANQGGGSFALSVSSSTLRANYFSIKDTDAKGLDIAGSSTVADLSHGAFLLSTAGNSMVTLSANAMNQTGTSSWATLSFASSTGVASGYNVTLAGTPKVIWDFFGSTGNMASDNFDNDAGDPRGYLIWDDSPDWLPRSQNWQWFYDQNLETPTSTAAGENVSPSNVGNGNALKLRLTIKEMNNLPGGNVKFHLEYSTTSDFSGNVYDLGEIGSSTSAWTYGDGIDYDNEPVTKKILSDSAVGATHNESGISPSNYLFAPNTIGEWEFTVLANRAATGTVYYFRAFANQPKIGAALPNGGETYPSLMVNQNALVSSLSGYNNGSNVAGISIGATSTPTAMPFGNLTFGVDLAGAQQLSVTTNAEFGYQLFVQQNHILGSANGAVIPDVPGDNANPAAWPTADVSAFGYHTSDMTLSGANPSRFASDNTYAKFETAMREVSFSAVPVVNEKTDIIYRIKAASQQKAGDYQNSIEYIVVPTY
jgi:hypothetical protein